jgi:hypothetical protein
LVIATYVLLGLLIVGFGILGSFGSLNSQ